VAAKARKAAALAFAVQQPILALRVGGCPAVTWQETSGAGTVTMQAYLAEYLPILIFLAIAIGLAAIIIVASLLVARQSPDSEKVSAYECGFEPFEDSRQKFDVRYYLVAILFIIFDLEVAFLFPWAVSLGNIGLFGFWSMVFFLGVLTVGFIYEWRKGALEWE
jgi:NADH-quinone oxidoreductase subunit A